jgi:hypothetical protein
MAHVLYGTPHPAYREMILRDSRGWFSPPPEYVWIPSGARRSKRLLDVAGGIEPESGLSLKAGQLPHRAIQILSFDFYRPIRPGALFAYLFREEYFNPVTSIDRVHHVLMKTRRWLARNEVPLAIVEKRGEYRIQGTGPYGLRRHLGENAFPLTTVGALLRRLELAGLSQFVSRDVRDGLRLSKAGTARFLVQALAEGRVVGTGQGCLRRYRLVARGGRPLRG